MNLIFKPQKEKLKNSNHPNTTNKVNKPNHL